MTTIEDERIERLNDARPVVGDYVLYWMQQSQRAEHNPALEYAIHRANERNLRLLVAFGLMDGYPEANARHYAFMLEGLADVQAALGARDIRFVIQRGAPDDVAVELGRRAALVVCDRGYLRHQRRWRKNVADALGCEVVQVEGDVVVPVETASNKAEYAARTIRPKLDKLVDRFLVPLPPAKVRTSSLNLEPDTIDIDTAAKRKRLLDALKVDRSVPPVSALFPGGTVAAGHALEQFIEKKIERYAEHRNQPQTDDLSHLSKYLHFGQISPVRVALQIKSTRHGSAEDRETLLEELIVRRELAQNFVHFTPKYDSFQSLPSWARATLKKHRNDRRSHRYTRQELENSETHDEYWNAAMREMRHTGYMHNYMRMYWGKKIVEWSNTPQYAYRVALDLNNRYFLDGRDGNSYAGVGWIFGLHDRPWTERAVFGTVRYMNAAGLERKCDPRAYVEKVDVLLERVRRESS